MSLDVNFFRSTVKDQCSYEGVSMVAGNNTMRGNLCAYVEGETRVWTCSASDSMCWTFAQECSGEDTQRQCSVNGAEWCCRSYEDCTQMPGQINICWGPWGNPLENMSAPDAHIYNQAQFPILPSLTTASAAGPTTTESSTAAPTATEASTTSDSSLSIGSIIGIGVGCGVAGAALAAGVGFLLIRRRRRGVSPGSAQRFDRPDDTRAQRLELSSDRMAEIDNGRVKEWPSELPAVRT